VIQNLREEVKRHSNLAGRQRVKQASEREAKQLKSYSCGPYPRDRQRSMVRYLAPLLAGWPGDGT